MRFRILLFFFVLFSFQRAAALPVAVSMPQQPASPQLRVSVLTVGVGEELYASFGHTAIRIIDSTTGTDEVYNYGVFDFYTPHFYTKFTLGRLLYYIDKSSFSDFMYEYEENQRMVQEQVLNLPETAKEKIQRYLENNLLPQNRGYYYSFFYDNCATRVRDIFPKVLGNSFHFGQILEGQKVTYRQVINHYLAQKHWERFGINLLLGMPLDQQMTDKESMFLPDYLHQGLEKATYQNKPIVVSDKFLLNKSVQTTHPLDEPLWLFVGIFILTALSFHVPAFQAIKRPICFLLLFLTGLLGCFMLFMWMGTDHRAVKWNWNVLWALPFNLLIAFVALKKRKWLKFYAVAAFILLFAALVVHVSAIQRFPLFELAPLLLSLIYVYADMWKRGTQLTATPGFSTN